MLSRCLRKTTNKHDEEILRLFEMVLALWFVRVVFKSKRWRSSLFVCAVQLLPVLLFPFDVGL